MSDVCMLANACQHMGMMCADMRRAAGVLWWQPWCICVRLGCLGTRRQLGFLCVHACLHVLAHARSALTMYASLFGAHTYVSWQLNQRLFDLYLVGVAPRHLSSSARTVAALWHRQFVLTLQDCVAVYCGVVHRGGA